MSVDEIVDVFVFQRRYTSQQWINICKAIRKRHQFDDWFYEEKNWDRSSVVYIRAEAIDWIDTVYHRKEKTYLDAEIEFSINSIKSLDEEKLVQLNHDYVDMTVRDLSWYFDVREEVIRNAISKLKILSIKKEDSNFKLVYARDVQKLEQLVFKKKYWKRLEEVRLCLKSEKYIR